MYHDDHMYIASGGIGSSGGEMGEGHLMIMFSLIQMLSILTIRSLQLIE